MYEDFKALIARARDMVHASYISTFGNIVFVDVCGNKAYGQRILKGCINVQHYACASVGYAANGIDQIVVTY